MISIIVPCYNIENYITECLDSLHRQTSQDFQLILIDDASSDGTLDKIKGYSHLKDFKNIDMIELPVNKGVSYARNEGILRARGEYFIFLDGDDTLQVDAIQVISEHIGCNHSIDLFGYDAYLCGTDRKKTKMILGSSSLVEQTHLAVRGYWSVVWRFVYRKEFILNNKIQLDDSLTAGEDYHFVCQVLTKAKSFLKIDKPLYNYATGQIGSAMTRINLKGMYDQIQATEKFAQILKSDVQLEPFIQDLNYRYLYLKKLFFKTALKIWKLWMPQSNNYIGSNIWRFKDKLVFIIISLLSKGLK